MLKRILAYIWIPLVVIVLLGIIMLVSMMNNPYIDYHGGETFVFSEEQEVG